jgi:DNA-binding Lrp family transcriptional regulator
MVKAQSAPGTTISKKATAQKASTELTAKVTLPLLLSRRAVPKSRVLVRSRQMVPKFARHTALCGKILCIDAIDQKILALLQQDGRLTVTDLAARVGLSVSPCHRRLRELERSKTIRGYRAVVDPAAVGLGFEALLFVTMHQEDRQTLIDFEAAVAAVPNVLHAQRLFGDPDYLLRIVTVDLAAYQRLYDDTLANLPGVQRLNSTLVMKTIVHERPLPA